MHDLCAHTQTAPIHTPKHIRLHTLTSLPTNQMSTDTSHMQCTEHSGISPALPPATWGLLAKRRLLQGSGPPGQVGLLSRAQMEVMMRDRGEVRGGRAGTDMVTGEGDITKRPADSNG